MRISWTIVIGLLAVVAAPAQEGRGPGRGRFPGLNIGFAALDTNGDGTLDAAEIEAAPRALAKLDKNGDGQITQEELRMAMPMGRGPGEFNRGERRDGERGGDAGASVVDDMVKTLMAFDANGDGKLSRSELPERFQGIFDRGDEDKDGFLTSEEIRKVAAGRPAPQQEQGRGEGPRGEMNMIRMDPVLAAIDANGDGTISADEIRNAAAAVRKLDKNGDGTISRDEAMPAMGPRRQF
jgi:Ca2+-binding EF-hand superfamily protein